MHVWALGLSLSPRANVQVCLGCCVKPRRLRGRGFHKTAREPQRAHLRVPALQTPPECSKKYMSSR